MAMVGSPGPANIILFALGCTQKFRVSIPFILSVVLSKQLIIWPIGFSLLLVNDLIDQYSSIMMLLSIIFILIQLIFHSAWFWFGSLVRQADLSEKNSRIVKIALLISLIASIVFSYY